MNLQTADPAVEPCERARAAGLAPGASALPWPGGLPGAAALASRAPVAASPAAYAAEGEHAAAMRESWRALWRSRLLVWGVGVATVLSFGFGPARRAFHAASLTHGFGWLGDLLAAPAARWDAAWYLAIADHGYAAASSASASARAAFFPLYPLLLGGLSALGLPAVAAGVLISVVALWLALYGIHRLTTLELRRAGGAPADRFAVRSPAAAGEVARLAVLLSALAPMAFFLSAVYSESLYLALSVGLFWFARQGRWALVGVLGGLAAATRNTGVLLLAPALILYLYGPSEEAREERMAVGVDGRRRERLHGLRRLRPRHRLRRDALWLALIPAGLGLYVGYLAISAGDPLMPLQAQAQWSRHLAGPFLAGWDGARAAFAGARQLLSFQSRHLYFPLAGSSPGIEAAHNLLLFGFLLAAIPAFVGVLRVLPLAYGAYVLAALALPLSSPVATQPLMSLPRFLLVLFPLNMWLALRLHGRRRAKIALLLAWGLLLAFFTAQFATWHWVA